jgi:hypothetical protein
MEFIFTVEADTLQEAVSKINKDPAAYVDTGNPGCDSCGVADATHKTDDGENLCDECFEEAQAEVD